MVKKKKLESSSNPKYESGHSLGGQEQHLWGYPVNYGNYIVTGSVGGRVALGRVMATLLGPQGRRRKNQGRSVCYW